MLIKLNNKPIDVVAEDKENKEYSWVYWCVSGIGYGLILCLMDYVCYTFFGHFAFPLLHFIWRLFV